jgi:hypothetical protein
MKALLPTNFHVLIYLLNITVYPNFLKIDIMCTTPTNLFLFTLVHIAQYFNIVILGSDITAMYNRV